MRILLSIETDDIWKDRARWVLGEMLGMLGFDVTENRPDRDPCVVLHYGTLPDDLRPNDPVVHIPFSGTGMPDAYEPGEAIELDDSGGRPGIAFPPSLPADHGAVIARAVNGDTVVAADGERPSLIHFGFDPVAPAYAILSRSEESRGARDDLDRYRPGASWLVRSGFLDRPVIDDWARLIGEAIGAAATAAGYGLATKAAWPGGQDYAISLTHDQDQSVRWERRLARHSLDIFRGGPRGRSGAIRMIGRDVREGPVRPTILSERLIDQCIDAGIRSTFFFLTIKKDQFGPRYDIGSRPFTRLLADLVDRGFAVGLHGSLGSYKDRSILRAERDELARRLGMEVRGVRQHYLRLNLPETWLAQREAGFSYDASLGYPDEPGYRGGTSFPFRPRDVDEMLVLPLNGMDRALVASGIANQAGWEEWSQPVRQVGGLLDILWHPYYTDPDLGPERQPAIRSLLNWIGEESSRAWVATMDEISDWWNARRFFTVVNVSRGADRTRIRYRSTVRIPQLTLLPEPRSSDIRIESVKGAIAGPAGAGRERGVRLGEIEAGAEIVVSIDPRP